MDNKIEQEIAQLERDLASKREVLKQSHEKGEIPELPHEKETLKEVVGEKLGPSTSSGQASGNDDSDQSDVKGQGSNVSNDALSYLSDELRGRVQDLVNLAFEKSIDEAIKQASATNNSALIDAFHDILVDELYKHLVERGKLHEL